MPTESLDPNEFERLASAEEKPKSLSVSPSSSRLPGKQPKSLNAYSNVMKVVKAKRTVDALSQPRKGLNPNLDLELSDIQSHKILMNDMQNDGSFNRLNSSSDLNSSQIQLPQIGKTVESVTPKQGGAQTLLSEDLKTHQQRLDVEAALKRAIKAQMAGSKKEMKLDGDISELNSRLNV